jgi:hypothetical protein
MATTLAICPRRLDGEAAGPPRSVEQRTQFHEGGCA